ncbi:MAG: porin family protein [Proteobacteria bacterium]|nr:porin family protein [Pseudomonadota bacterium]
MKRACVLASIPLALISIRSEVVAADLGPTVGSLKDQAREEPFFNWQGLYGGVFLGGVEQNWTVDFYRNNNHGHADEGASGLAYGGWVGYNVMVAPRVVLGVEADLGRANASQMNNIFDNDTSYSAIGTFGSLRARYGYAVDRFLIYGTAGLAFASVTNDIQKGRNAGEQIVYDDQWRTGYAVGGGVEYALTKNLIARAEYIYSNYGQVSLYNRDGNLAEMTNEMHLVRVGLSYKF